MYQGQIGLNDKIPQSGSVLEHIVYDFAKYSPKLHEIERIRTGGVPLAPLRSATAFVMVAHEKFYF